MPVASSSSRTGRASAKCSSATASTPAADALRDAEPAVKFAIDTFVGVSTSSDAKRWGDYLEGVLTTAGVPLERRDPRGPSRNPRVSRRQQSVGRGAGGRRSGARTHTPARPDGGRRLERQRHRPARVRSPWPVVVLRRGLRFAFRRRREAATPVLRDRARAMLAAARTRHCTSATCTTWTSSARGTRA